MRISLGEVYRDAWQIYRLLLRRSVVTAALVFAITGLVDAANNVVDEVGATIVLGLVTSALDFSGPVIVQGALVEIVRNIHEGSPPKRIWGLYTQASRRFWSLLWASIVYGFGVIFGLVLMIVPGLLAAARWCLMAPLIVLEDRDADSARSRSSELVRGHTRTVLTIVVVTYVLLGAPLLLANLFLPIGWVARYALTFAWTSLTAPLEAHLLTVIYYRLTDPDRPVIHSDVLRWDSVWDSR
jgi:hypothetical protein